MEGKQLEKLLTKTPIISCVTFLLFTVAFNMLVSNYQITSYQTREVVVLRMDYTNNMVYLASFEDKNMKIDTEVQLVYSDQEQVIKGRIKEINNEEIQVQFEQLKRLKDVQIIGAEYKFAVGKIFIKEELGLWK